MATGQVWMLSAQGGYFANPALSRNLYKVSQPNVIFEQFVDEEENFGKSRGDILDYNKVFNVNVSGSELVEGVRIPQANFTIGRGRVVAKEYGLAIPWTSKYALLSQFEPEDPIQSALTDDRAKTHDRVFARNFKGSLVKYIPTGTAGSPTATWDLSPTLGADGIQYTTSTSATRDLQLFDLKNIVDAFRKGVFGASATGAAQPVKPFTGTDFAMIAAVDTCRAIFDDPDFEEAIKYGDPQRLWNGENGRIYATRIFMEQYNLSLLGTSGYKGAGMMFGKQTVKRITVVPPEMRRAIPGDYGRDLGMCWYSVFGSDTIWKYNVTSEPMNSIVEIASA